MQSPALTVPEPEGSRAQWARHAHSLMQFGLLFYIALFPIGISLREIGSILTLAGLLGLYGLSWKTTRLSTLRFRWIYLAFMAFILFKVFHSEYILTSWRGVGPNLYQGFPLLLAGIEFPRRDQDLRHIVWAFVFESIILGLDGVYQAIYGVDFIIGTPSIYGRLTGSMSTPRAGNYISIVIPISLALIVTLPSRWSRASRYAALLSVLALQGFFLAGTGTRSAMLGVLTALGILGMSNKRWYLSLLGMLGSVGLMLWMLPERFMMDRIQNDLRFVEVWPQAIELFRHYPVLGSGFNTFGKAAVMIGDPANMAVVWPHPHNIYLQFLCEAGLVGLIVLCVFLFGTLIWIARSLHNSAAGAERSADWVISLCLFASVCGYATTAFSAHNFFRTWWLGIAFAVFGLTIGASQLTVDKTKNNPRT